MKSYNTRAEANAANAQHSTGPKTEEGKRIASHNALKTGLTGRTVLLPTDDVAAFEAHMARLAKRYSPVGEEEQQLVENLGHIEWRLARIPTLETGILAVGREEFADLYTDKSLDVRRTMIEAKVHLTYAKPLANLALQENRLQRQHEKQRTRLAQLKAERESNMNNNLAEAMSLYRDCETKGKPFPLTHLQQLGFEFPVDVLRQRMLYCEAKRNGSIHPNITALELAQTRPFHVE
jgi:hypothetical protein